MNEPATIDPLEAVVALGVEIIFTVRHFVRRIDAVKAQVKGTKETS